MQRDRVREVPAGRKLVADRPQDTARRTHLDRDPAQLKSDGVLTTETWLPLIWRRWKSTTSCSAGIPFCSDARA